MASVLYGPDGQPIRSETLTTETVLPSVTGVRQVFDATVAANLDPVRLARILKQAADGGDLHDFLTLAEEMEEREWQYRSVLSTRKTAVKSIEPFVQAATDAKEDVAIADAVTDQLVRRPDFRDLIGDMLDALGKGYSVTELVWATSEKQWTIERFEWRDPRLFQFDPETRRTLRLRMKDVAEGVDLAPYKYIRFIPRLKSGLPARNGLARIAAWAFMLKSFTMKDWAAFIEVHGMPLRLGKYSRAASREEKGVLLRAVRDLGADAAAIIPADMSIDFIETKGFSEKPFESMAGYLDKAVSKVVIGQTMTADDGSSKAQAAVHDKVRIDIKEDDAVAVAVAFNRDVIRPWVDLNFGRPKNGRYPVIILPVMEREDLAAYAKAIGELVDRGLDIEVSEVRDRIGHREPAKGAKIMQPRSSAAPAAPLDDPAPDPEPSRNAAVSPYRLQPACCPACGTTERLSADGDPSREINALVDQEMERFEEVMDPLRQAIDKAFRAAKDYDDLDTRLTAIAAELPIDALAARLAIAGLKAWGLGRSGTA